MFIPYNTDAPLYSRPIGTVLLIVCNFIAFGATAAGQNYDGWLLEYGRGYHPSQWVASVFLHFGVAHLLGNIVFLWAFGMIVEGKIGTLRFLGLYLLMALINGVVIQTLMMGHLRAEPPIGAGGASGVIFGLMAIALLWAPVNEFEVIWVYFGIIPGARTVEIRVMTFAMLYLVLNALLFTLRGGQMGTEFLHLQGALTGAGAGYLLLRKGWVDCEGWDLFSVWKRNPNPGVNSWTGWKGRSSFDPEPVMIAHLNETPDERLERFDRQLQSRHFESAFHLWEKIDADGKSRSKVTLPSLRALIEGLQKDRRFQQSALVIERGYLPRMPAHASRARLKLAAMLVKELQRPRAAIRQLGQINSADLGDAEQRLASKILAAAQAQIEDGVMEIA